MSDRKYGQRGYQEGGERPEGRRRDRQPREKPTGPWGRGLGRPELQVFRCRDCGQAASPRSVEPDSLCSQCESPLHACVNCSNFDPSARWECRADIVERVPSKTKANECPLYQPKVVLETGDSIKDGDAKAAFDALFDL